MWFSPVWLAAGFTTPDWTKDSDQAEASFGWSVSSAGDVNGDGFFDVVVGAPDHDRGQTDEGGAFVFLGSAGGPPSVPDWSVESDQESSAAGSVVASAGDVNGDGFDDLLVTAPDYDIGVADEGQVWVYHGSDAGPATDASWTGQVDQPAAAYGYAAASAGDVNGDGYADVIVGASLYDGDEVDEGGTWVHLGSAAGLSTAAAWSGEGDQTGAELGSAVASSGDVNGDGFDDVLVGAHAFDDDSEDQGRADLYFGSASGLETVAAWTASTNRPSAHYGWSVAGAGDVNADGFADVLVGAPYWDLGTETDEGKAVLYTGSATGLAAASAWGFELDSSFEHVGWSVASAGDVNGDGFADVALGADNWDNPEPFEGAAFVFFGAAAGLATTAAYVVDSGQSFCDFGWSVATAGDVDGDGVDDLLVGAPRYSDGDSEEGRAYLYRGACADPTDDDDDGSCASIDCDDADPTTFPGAPEVCDGLDNACTGSLPAGERDEDGDGFALCAECDDADPARFPSAVESCNGIDDDCDGSPGPDELDEDGDGVSSCAGDCDDADAERSPDLLELCGDPIDNNCDGALDETCNTGTSSGGCGCNGAAGGGAGAPWILLASLLARARRRQALPSSACDLRGLLRQTQAR